VASDWPRVHVLFATFKRTEAALDTICSLEKYLKYPDLHFHICDDGSGESDDGSGRPHIEVLLERFKQFAPDTTAHEMPTPHGEFNTGGNINYGIELMRQQGDSIYLLNFDDWALLKELDIRPHVEVLDTCPEVGFIRLSWLTPGIAGVCVRYDAPRSLGPMMWLRIIRQWSTQNPWATDSYVVSMQPFIAHVRFHEAYGMFKENVYPGLCETEMTERYLQHPYGENGPQILHPIGGCWDHSNYGHMAARAHYYARM